MNLTHSSTATYDVSTQPNSSIGIPTDGATLKDEDLNQWLQIRYSNKHSVVLVYAGHRCKVFDEAIVDASLLAADPDKESLKTLKKLAKTCLLKRVELPANELRQAVTVNQTWIMLDATPDDVAEWMKKRDAFFGQGRGKAISESTSFLVWHAAASRCMYRGCSEDLGITALTTKKATRAYLAHIIASDPNGPRGETASSHNLSDDHENIMLMCDGHHRLIDRIDEDGHSVELLRDMRREHVRMVRKMLDGLAFPRAQAITLLADIANIPTIISENNIRNSMLARQLGPLPDVFHAIRRTQRDDRLRLSSWENILHEHELAIRDFVVQFGSGSSRCLTSDAMAVFPLHLIPILVLAGRIVGEARPVEVFQYDRHRKSWQWDLAAIPQPANAFQVNDPSDTHADEVLLSIELTASVDERALPEAIASQVQNGSIPWVRVTATQPDPGCISHPDDLVQFTTVARKAIKIIQDGIRPSRVHLLGVSPASTLFRFGQLLQAGHHPAYNVYDRPDRDTQFKPGLSIEGQQVICAAPSDNNHTKTIQLR
jgi:hypothetical protein